MNGVFIIQFIMTTRKRTAYSVILSLLLALDMSVVIYVVHKLI